MGFKEFSQQQQGVELLQRSLERGRLGHGYLFNGDELEELKAIAVTLAKTLNCQRPVKKGGRGIDCCDECLACRKIKHGNHPDVHWVLPESKTRIIRVEQIRELMQEINLKPTEAEYKMAVLVAADRLKSEAANAFLKTLEEPPTKSILILLTTEPQRMLETIVSRCLRLNFAGNGVRTLPEAQMQWLTAFSEMAAAEQKSLLGRYRLLDVLLRRLAELKGAVEQRLTAGSPLQVHKDAEKELVERWEDELAAAVEAEYRRQRGDLLSIVQWWLRDVWLQVLSSKAEGRPSPPGFDANAPEPMATERAKGDGNGLLRFPQLMGTRKVAQRISATDALENLQVLEQLQRWLGTNVQEALALEVSLLKLRL